MDRETGEAREERLLRVLALSDRGHTAATVELLSEDVTVRFAGGPVLHGRAAVKNSIDALLTTVRDTSPTNGNLAERVRCGDRGGVTYTRLDGSLATVPSITAARFDGEEVRDYQIFIDLAPVYDGH